MTRLPSHTLPALVAMALLYLGLPCVLFLLAWVELWLALPAVLLLVAGGVQVWKSVPRCSVGVCAADGWKLLAVLLGCLVVLELLAGFHGHAPQPGDFAVRNPLYEMLIAQDWPLQSARGEAFVYYHCFWLPPALLAKAAAGFFNPYTLLFWWVWGGLALGFCLFFMRIKGRVLTLFLLLCGLGCITEWVSTGGRGFMESHGAGAMVALMDALLPVHNMSYVAWGTQVTWTFNHAIPVCVLMALLLPRHLPRKHWLYASALVVPASPLAAVCLLAWFGLLLPALKNPTRCWSILTSASLWCAFPLVGVSALYFTMGEGTHIGTVFPHLSDPALLQSYLLCMLWTVLPACVFLRPYRRTALFAYALLLSVVLPSIIVGAPDAESAMGVRNNELLYKGSLPLFYALAWLYLHRMEHAPRALRGLIVLYIIASSGMIFWRGLRAVNHYTWEPESMRENIRSEYGGHLNHPEWENYSDFWSARPAPWPLKQGASAPAGE